MHELSIMSSILEIVLEYANANDAKKVAQINIEVGELSDLVSYWMQNYFEYMSKDTIANKALLSIDRVPAMLRCCSCNKDFTMTKEDWRVSCPHCNSAEIEILSGREFKIVSIEIE
jgi:hydrogenase nickel incorporation protein HypA/HybF